MAKASPLTEATQITFIGQIRNISTQTTNTTYRLDDGTGTVEVKVWNDPDPGNSSNLMDTDFSADMKPAAKLVENGYARAWGQLKAFNNKRHVGARFIRPVQDYNEISYHLLEATYVHLYFTRGPPEQLAGGNKGRQEANGGAYGAGQQQQQDMYGDGGAGGGGGGFGVPLSALSEPARRVYQALRSSPQNNEGLHVQDIAARLRMQLNDVLKAGDELLGQSRIYTTVDDNTWAILEM